MRIFPFALVAIFSACASRNAGTPVAKPLVIGHRGAAGHLPEHTLESYTLAIQMGADFIEPDLVPTKDGVLIARHENDISDTTDVAQKFPKRKTKKKIEGKEIEGWFTEDFTLKEIKSLRARERIPQRSHAHDGQFLIPTFEEVVALAQAKSKETGRVIGIYPETKHPSHFRSLGLPLEESLLRILDKNGYTERDSPAFIRSFEVGNLKELRKKTKLRLVQLVDEPTARPYDFVLSGDKRTWADLMKPEELKKIREYADGIGPWKRLIVPEGKLKNLEPPTTLVADAHAAGLLVHPYTFRSDPPLVAPVYGAKAENEYLQFFRLGVDGVFSDFPDDAVKARELFLKEKSN